MNVLLTGGPLGLPWTRSLFFFLLISVKALLGQSALPVIELEPSVPVDQDSLAHHVYLGAETDSFVNVLEISCTFSVEGYEIKAGTSLQVSVAGDSWLADDGNVLIQANLDSSRQVIELNIQRTDGQPRSGYGYLASVNGIVVSIEEVGKRSPVSLRLLEWYYVQAPSGSLVLEARAGQWSLRSAEETDWVDLELRDFNGRVLRKQRHAGQLTQIYMWDVPPGTYVLRGSSALGHQLSKKCVWVK